jgi:hypothetical protein
MGYALRCNMFVVTFGFSNTGVDPTYGVRRRLSQLVVLMSKETVKEAQGGFAFFIGC